MARGQESKDKVFKRMLEVFEESFLCDGGKVLRIPCMEDGEVVEIKVALTAAKDVLGAGVVASESVKPTSTSSAPAPAALPEMTQEEKDNVKSLMEALGL